MDFREIQYVAAIRDQQTLSGAARYLGITQPSVSKFLQNLEREIGVKLFERMDNRLTPTYAGEQYLEAGLKILDLGRQLSNNLNDISRSFRGRLSVGITPTRGRYVLPNVLPEFKKAYPDYSIKILEGGVDELNESLLSGTIDLAVYTVADGSRADFLYEPVCKEEIVLAISPLHPLAETAICREGRKHPWIDVRRFGSELFFLAASKFRTRRIADRILSEALIQPEIIELQSIESALSIAASGIGAGFCTDMCERFFCAPKPLKYCSVGERDNEWDFVIAHRKDSYLSEAAGMFIQITKNQFSELEFFVDK